MPNPLIENPMVVERPQRPPEPPVKLYKPDEVCACGCGKWAADGFITEEGTYLYSKDCYIKYSFENGWLRVREDTLREVS